MITVQSKPLHRPLLRRVTAERVTVLVDGVERSVLRGVMRVKLHESDRSRTGMWSEPFYPFKLGTQCLLLSAHSQRRVAEEEIARTWRNSPPSITAGTTIRPLSDRYAGLLSGLRRLPVGALPEADVKWFEELVGQDRFPVQVLRGSEQGGANIGRSAFVPVPGAEGREFNFGVRVLDSIPGPHKFYLVPPNRYLGWEVAKSKKEWERLHKLLPDVYPAIHDPAILFSSELPCMARLGAAPGESTAATPAVPPLVPIAAPAAPLAAPPPVVAPPSVPMMCSTLAPAAAPAAMPAATLHTASLAVVPSPASPMVPQSAPAAQQVDVAPLGSGIEAQLAASESRGDGVGTDDARGAEEDVRRAPLVQSCFFSHCNALLSQYPPPARTERVFAASKRALDRAQMPWSERLAGNSSECATKS